MFLKFYHPNGCIKYTGWIKGCGPKQQGKNVDINGIFLPRFDGHLVKEFDERGNLIDMGLVKKNKIVRKTSAFRKGILYECCNNRRIKYIGNWFYSQYHGKGVLYFNGEKFYVGDFCHGKFHGKGKLFCPRANRLIFSGEFKHGLPFEGSFFTCNKKTFTGFFKHYCGFLSLPYDDNLYIGWMEKGKRTDTGVLYNYKMYEKYIGYWKDDMYHGKGTLYDETCFQMEYEGQFQYGKKHGKGTLYGAFEKYIGEFQNDKREGYGILYDGDEIVYYGMWKEDCYDGKGFTFTKDETLLYKGQFKKNNIDGYGTFYYENGNIAYTGSVKDGKYNGYGELYYPNTKLRCFEGFFENGKYKKGIYHDENGKLYNYQHDDWEGIGSYFSHEGVLIYQGMLKNGEYHGNGTLLHKDFSIHYVGTFCRGKFHGHGYFQTYNGIIFRGNFVNGLFEQDNTLYHLDIYNDLPKIPVFQGITKEGCFLDGIETKYDDNFEEILETIIWKNGEIFNQKEERLKLRQEMLIHSYFETRDQKFLSKISKKGYLDYIQKKYKVLFSKQNLMSKKQLRQWIENKTSSIQILEISKENYDLFGNEIIIPVQGSDGETYDESSLISLFTRDEITKDYINISYIYDKNGQRVPNYPIMSNGKSLFYYKK